jgi:hypothetical protein
MLEIQSFFSIRSGSHSTPRKPSAFSHYKPNGRINDASSSSFVMRVPEKTMLTSRVSLDESMAYKYNNTQLTTK